MDCREAVYSNDYYDFISQYGEVQGLDIGPDTCRQPLDPRYDIVYINKDEIPSLNLSNFNYLSIPFCLGPLDTGALEASGILRVQNLPTLSLKGQGVLIGFLDSGIEYENQLFQNTDGSSRIEAIWDQTIAAGTPPEGFIYGHEYRKEDIDEALRADDPQSVVATVDETGHGTFVAGAAAGNADIGRNFSGAAPLAGIAMVKLKPAKQYLRDFFFIREDAEAYQLSDLIAGLTYLDNLAEELDMPLVICIGVGSSYASHSGTSGPVKEILDRLTARSRRGVVVAAGNEANYRLHYSSENLETGQDEIVEIDVGEDVAGFTVELWAKTPDIYSAEIISPTGERLPRTPARSGTRTEHAFVFEGSIVSLTYRVSDVVNGQQMIFFRFDKPSQGIWNIRIYADTVLRGGYNMWMTFSEFLTGNVFFIRSNPDITLTTPGTMKTPITVGAYDSSDNSIYINSGRGFLPLGDIKPDFVAPGVNVTGAGLNNTLTLKSGTSVAAAITAGAVALVLEWAVLKEGNDFINSMVIKYLLIRGTVKDEGREYPDKQWGYGKLNLYEAFNVYRLT